jgi:HSP20 family protein
MSTAIAVQPKTTGRSIIDFPQGRSIFDDFDAITNQIAQRAFGLFRERGTDGRDLDDWFRAESELLKSMPVELSESDKDFTVKAEVPGFSIKDLTVRAESNSVCIHGKKQETKEEKDGKKVRYSEVSSSEICRRIDLPASINPDKVSASLNNGVLELNIPKAAPPKTIEVKVA